MSKDPAVLFYTSDFLTGTALFTDEERGQYIVLLCQQHQLGRLPKRHMLNICKTSDSQVFSKFKIDECGLYYNERLEKESIRRKSFCESRRLNRLEAIKTTLKESTSVELVSPHTYPRMETETENENRDINVIKKKGSLRGKGFLKPTLEDVIEFFKVKKTHIDPEKFFTYYETRGWEIKGSKIKNWKMCLRTWEKSDFNNTNTKGNNNGKKQSNLEANLGVIRDWYRGEVVKQGDIFENDDGVVDSLPESI